MNNWENKKLGQVINYASGTSFSNKYQGRHGLGYDFYKVSDMNFAGNEIYMRQAANTVDDELVKQLKGKVHPKGTVIFPKVGAALLTNKRRILSKPSLFDNNVMGIVGVQGVQSKYLFYFLQTIDFNQYVQSGAVPSINMKIVDSIPIQLPPLEEQEKITAILTSVDEAIEKTEAIIEQTEKVKKGLMQQLLTKGIRQTDFKESEVGNIPRNWEVESLGNVLKLIKSGISRMFSSEDIGYPVIRSTNISKNDLNLEDLKYWHLEDPKGANLQNLVLEEGDLLLNFINSPAQIGKCCIFDIQDRDFIYTTNIFRIQVNESKLINKYFYYFTQTNKYQSLIDGIVKPAVNQASFTKEDFKKLKIALPPLYEQEQIVEILYSVDTKIKIENIKFKKLQALKKSLMQILLTGHVRVKVDEPEVVSS